jgi:hypothetical protein
LLDADLSLDLNVQNIRKSAFLHLRLISKIRRYLSKKQAALLVHSLAASRINFCSSLHAVLTKKQQQKLQSILNYGARIIDKLKITDNVSSSLRNNNLLSIESRACLSLLSIVHSALLHNSPFSLASLLQYPPTPTRVLRSNINKQLIVPRTKSKSGDKAFGVLAPSVYNSLPPEIRQISSAYTFKSRVRQYFLM